MQVNVIMLLSSIHESHNKIDIFINSFLMDVYSALRA